MKPQTIVIVLLIFDESISHSFFPQFPSGRRSQFLIFGNAGTRYEPKSNFSNQVTDRSIYTNSLGQNVHLNYSGDTQEFHQPNKLTTSDLHSKQHSSSTFVQTSTGRSTGTGRDSPLSPVDSRIQQKLLLVHSKNHIYTNTEVVGNATPESNRKSLETNSESVVKSNSTINVLNPDGSFFFSYTWGGSSRLESVDSDGNVQGKYSYIDDAGAHDLTYTAGKETGFIATGGSLAIPNGLKNIQSSASESPVFYSVPFETPPNNDSSYSFEYSSPLHSRQEIGDNKGNVYGRYSFVNEGGNHDLLYVAGSSTGFLPIGGSLVKSTSTTAEKEKTKDISGEDGTERESSKSQLSSVVDFYNSGGLVEKKNQQSLHKKEKVRVDSVQQRFEGSSRNHLIFNENLGITQGIPYTTVLPTVGHVFAPSVIIHSYILPLHNENLHRYTSDTLHI